MFDRVFEIVLASLIAEQTASGPTRPLADPSKEGERRGRGEDAGQARGQGRGRGRAKRAKRRWPSTARSEVETDKDFSAFQADDMAEIARAILLIAKQLATRESRRTRAAPKSHLIDLRRTLRRNLKYGGTIIELAHKSKKIRKPRIVLICDVSRSMDSYRRFLLQFIYAFQNSLGRVESFVFSTSLTRVTDYFKNEEIVGGARPHQPRGPRLVGRHPHRSESAAPSTRSMAASSSITTRSW